MPTTLMSDKYKTNTLLSFKGKGIRAKKKKKKVPSPSLRIPKGDKPVHLPSKWITGSSTSGSLTGTPKKKRGLLSELR